jgi:DNA-directed RNA polymerase subunit RPC12/RpoP
MSEYLENVYYCSVCGLEFRDWLHRNSGSFHYYCRRCKKETLFSEAIREVVVNVGKGEQVFLVD